jgi:GntR family transcriptional regulator
MPAGPRLCSNIQGFWTHRRVFWMTNGDPKYLFEKEERFRLDASSPVPLYHQMQNVVQDRILSDDALGCMLPAEKDLMVIFGVSRATVKKTLDNLASKGLIQRRRALGTKVISQQIVENLARLTSYTEEMAARGLEVRTQVLDVRRHDPGEVVRERLGLKEGEQTIRIRRLRGNDEVFPVVLLDSELSPHLGLDPNQSFETSIYTTLEQEHGVQIEWAQEDIGARGATAREAKYLEIKPEDSVLVMERLTFAAEDRPIEFVQAVYRPDRFRYSIRLTR